VKKIRIGVWITDDYQPHSGGAYNYYTQLLDKLRTYKFQDAELLFVGFNDHSLSSFTHKHIINWRPFRLNRTQRLLSNVAKRLRIDTLEDIFNKREAVHIKKLKKELSKHIDVLYYAIPTCAIDNFPYVYTFWDLGHLSMYAFPEVSMNGIFEKRVDQQSFPCKALMVFCESKAGIEEASRYLNINADRLRIIPLFPSEIVGTHIAAQKPQGIPSDTFFIHYPAQYWAHKNHFNLLVALQEVIKTFSNLKLVLTGSDKGNKDYINQVITELSLTNHVLDLGFISKEEIKWLYQNSKGLVMPTFLGPTNMPLIEAAELGCPVACSNLTGHKEQLGDYGYYFDPKKPGEIANAICQMLNDRLNHGARPYQSKFNIDNALLAMNEAFSELRNIRFCWGNNDEIY
jgi:glycosyltransferase involved in cell wall biosynthesis